MYTRGADTSICFLVGKAVQLGSSKIFIRTVDTGVVVLAVAYQQHVKATELWVAFDTVKHFRYIPGDAISSNLEMHSIASVSCYHRM